MTIFIKLWNKLGQQEAIAFSFTRLNTINKSFQITKKLSQPAPPSTLPSKDDRFYLVISIDAWNGEVAKGYRRERYGSFQEISKINSIYSNGDDNHALALGKTFFSFFNIWFDFYKMNSRKAWLHLNCIVAARCHTYIAYTVNFKTLLSNAILWSKTGVINPGVNHIKYAFRPLAFSSIIGKRLDFP